MQSDEQIIESLRQGSYEAFDTLYLRYAPHVEAFAFCMLKNRTEAEDIAHDIFLKLWESRVSMGEVKSFRRYLFTMTRNAIYDYFEHKSVQNRYEQVSIHTERLFTEDVYNKIASEDLLMIIDMAVSQMPEQRRRIFHMSRYENLSYHEIAERLGISTKTVEYHIHAAITELKKIVGIAVFFF